VAGIDKTLTDKGYISPGLGDAVSAFDSVCVVTSRSNFRGTVYSTLCNRDESENVSSTYKSTLCILLRKGLCMNEHETKVTHLWPPDRSNIGHSSHFPAVISWTLLGQSRRESDRPRARTKGSRS
jgi:hypothetical protein